MEKLIKMAVKEGKDTQRVWIEKGNNPDFNLRVQLYENGYIVSMFHSAASPQNYLVSQYMIGDELGAKVYDGEDNFGTFPTTKTSDLVDDILHNKLF